MNACIVTIGDEILIGQIVDTNSVWIAEQVNLLGIRVNEIISISDNPDHIKQTLSKYEGKVDIVLITGGLGPTRDDITKSALAEYFDSKLVNHPEVIEHINELFKNRGIKISEINKLQAMLPDNCMVLKNPSGTAQGMWFERGGTIFVSMPGVPYEMRDIMRISLLPVLSRRIKGQIVVHKTIMTQGVSETYLSERLNHWETNLPSNLKLAYLPKPGIVRLRLTATGIDRGELEKILEVETANVLNIISRDVYGFDDESLEKVIGDILVEKSATLATAESCTGGNIARLITSVPGSSRYFKGSIVAYSNIIKKDFLGVNPASFEKFGAVSQEVVEKMANEILSKFNSDYAIATSGIAGPDGSTPEKPVGTTWISVSSAKKTVSTKFLFGEHRGRNIEKASNSALNMLRKMILEIE
jgi:nicotinamide-nucleotide amidase